MDEFPYRGELHPFHRGARIMCALRAFSNIRGWERLSALLVPEATAGPFRVSNQSGLFAGDLSSFIDRSMYLRGGYEENHIRAFLSHVPAERRDVILGVGANVGTHSLAFSRHFKTVHAFEPNPNLWGSFETNMALNNLSNVSLHRLGLADRDDELTLYPIDKEELWLGNMLHRPTI